MIDKYHNDILSYVDILKFSIYGLSKSVYEKVMGGIKFEKSYENIISLLDKDINKTIYTAGNFILMEENKRRDCKNKYHNTSWHNWYESWNKKGI